MVTVAANHKVLEWARTELELTLVEAAELLGIDLQELAALESGTTKPTLTILRAMASKYRVSLATMAMPEPLPPTKKPADFRTIEGREEKISRKTAIAIRQARSYLQRVQEVLAEEEDLAVRYTVPDADPNETYGALAIRERERLGITVNDQLRWTSDNQALRVWRDKLETLGIFTFFLDFPVEDCEGFSLRESANPGIAISKRAPTEGAKIFTLLHEYGHLLINKPGISNLNNGNNVERFCNNFAAAVLMPEVALRAVLQLPDPKKPQQWDLEDIRVAARKLHVSQQSLGLRLETTGYAPAGFFDALRAVQPKRTVKSKKEANIPPHVKRLSEVGAAYAGAALASYDRGNMSDLETYRMLNLSPRHFEDLRIRLKGRLPYHGASQAVP